MDNQKQQVIDRLQKANNVLLTVSKNPSVDQLAACIGLSLALNKLGKHATAVFSGETPSTIEFLKPEETIEKNTDSLRDFIISLDKSKADKLRYKVEDQVVRIFITPYKTSITSEDLDFSQGDFNVDVVLAIGVQSQDDLDQAITAHGRILHDATIITVNTTQGGTLAGMDWIDTETSSLSEMASQVAIELGKDILDEQIATALLTGVVAETERFSNEKTSANTMKTSATLMAAGANQQLVANELEEAQQETIAVNDSVVNEGTVTGDVPAEQSSDGTLQIDHTNDPEKPEPKSDQEQSIEPLEPAPEIEIPEPPVEYDDPNAVQPKVADNTGAYKNPRQHVSDATQPAFTSADSVTNEDDGRIAPSIDLPPVAPEQVTVTAPPAEGQTLQDIERSVKSAHLEQADTQPVVAEVPKSPEEKSNELNLADLQRPAGIDEDLPNVDAARDAVAEAMTAAENPGNPAPIVALNAQPLGEPIRDNQASPAMPSDTAPVPIGGTRPMVMPVPTAVSTANPEDFQQNDTSSGANNSAPPVPPPFMPPTFGG